MKSLTALLAGLSIASALVEQEMDIPDKMEIALQLFSTHNCTEASHQGWIDLSPHNPLAHEGSGWFECADRGYIDDTTKGLMFVLRDDPPKLEHCRIGAWSGRRCRGGKEGVIARTFEYPSGLVCSVLTLKQNGAAANTGL